MRWASSWACTSRCRPLRPTSSDVPQLDVVRAPAAVLSAVCTDVDASDRDVVRLAEDLVATMRAHAGCVGLAANQVGVPWRVFCLDVGGHPKTRSYAGLVVLANPRLVEASRWERG